MRRPLTVLTALLLALPVLALPTAARADTTAPAASSADITMHPPVRVTTPIPSPASSAGSTDDGTPATLPSVAALAPATTPGLVMAMDRLLPGATDGKIKPLLGDEARAILNLYLAGTIREWYFRQDRPGAVFILDTNADNARKLLDQLPLVKAGLVGFDIIPIGPYIPLATLLQHDSAPKKKHRK